MESLARLEVSIETEYPHIRSLLVSVQEGLVFERYFQGDGPDVLHHFASGAKSFTSALVGVLLQQGLLASVDQRLIDFYGQLPKDADARMCMVTVEHLLKMASGLHWGDSPPEVNRWLAQGDWLNRTIRLPVTHTPGTFFEYKPDPRLLSWIIERQTGGSVIAFAEAHLFEPLGIREWYWPDDGTGDGIQLKPTDIAKMGRLFLQGGIWNGEPLIPSSYVAASTRMQIQGGFPERDGYGYLWWTTQFGTHRAFYASGFGGQYLFVIPEKEMVIVITSAMDRPHVENKFLVSDWLSSTEHITAS